MAAAAMKHMASSFAKLEKFEGVDFRRWQKKMHFMLSSMSVVYVLTTPMPEDGGENPTVEQVRKRAKWDNDDYVCRGLILNGMSDSLFDVYQNVETSKELWDTLEAKYMAEDASSKKFLVSNFTNYKMTDSRPVLEQYNELLGILGRFTQHNMNMDESIKVSCIIDKLPPSWKDFKHTLKHLKEELTLIELGSHLRIEESLRAQDNDKPKGNNVAGPSVVNMVEHNNSSRYNDNKGKRKHHDTRANPNKKPKVTCWKCGKPGHLKKDCKAGNVGNRANGSGTKGSEDGSSNPLKGQTFSQPLNCMIQFYGHARLGHVENTLRGCKNMLKDGDLCDLHATPSLGNKKNFVTFIDEGLPRSKSRVPGAVVRLPDPKLKTLSKRGIECIFVGYAEHSKAFRFYVIELNDSVAINSTLNQGMLSLMSTGSHLSLDQVRCPWMYPKTFDEAHEALKMLFMKETINLWVAMDLQKENKSGTYQYQKTADSYDINSQSDNSSYGCKTTFLNGELEEEAPKQWHQKFDEVVLSNGYLLNQADKCVYRKFDASGKGVIICLYVDDMLIFGTNQVQVDMTKEFLSSRFSMKNMGEADVILVSTPLDTCVKLMPNRGLAVSQLKYSRVIGCLMYAMTCTRPDIAFAVGKQSRYTSNPDTQHWQVIQRVLKYLKKIMDYRLVYSGYPSVLEGCTDASWISNTKDNSSTSGWVFLLGGGAISWASKKQTCITGSIMESKFVALAATGKEAEWLKNLLLEISTVVKL
ncbi:zinc finger, CCHC-type containing protein [Tanacetum coccineum]